MKSLGEILEYEQPTKYIVKSENYDNSYSTPVLTPGQTFILGYTNEKDGIYSDPLPVIIFDDFTTATKLVNFPFKVKSSAMKILKPANKNVYILYWYYYLSSLKVDNDLHKRYWISTFANRQVPVPALSEQKRIAERLDKVQELIALQKEQLKKLDDLIKSRFIDLFGNPITNPKGWPLYALHEIATLNPSRSNMPEHTLVSFIPMDAVSTDGYILYQKSGSYASFKKGFTPFIEGDILFAKITPCMENGKGCIATQLQNRVGFGSTEFHVVRPNSSVNTKFLSFILQSRFFRRIAARHMTGSAGQRRVPISFLETYKIALPPKSLQTQFADFVTKIDSQKGLLTTRLSHLETLYKSLMQEYFG